MSSQKEIFNSIEEGQTILNRGDMANPPQTGIVTKKEDTLYGRHIWILWKDGRHEPCYPTSFQKGNRRQPRMVAVDGEISETHELLKECA